MISAVFFNFAFWCGAGGGIWMCWPILPYALLVGGVAVLIPALFFAAPLAMSRSMGVSMERVLENAVGAAPAFGLRICAVLFLLLWMARMIAAPVLWMPRLFSDPVLSEMESWMVGAATVIYVVVTGLRSTEEAAKLAFFGNKLGLALLLAAMIRVHDGLPAAVGGFRHIEDPSATLWRGVSHLTFYAAPLCFLAGRLAQGVRGRGQQTKAAIFGIAVPLFVVLMMIGVTNAATAKSRVYQPSLNPDLAMALLGKASRIDLWGRAFVLAVTMFGALRFGLRLLTELVAGKDSAAAGIGWGRLGGLALALVWLTLRQDSEFMWNAWNAPAACLIGAAAVVTADWVMGERRVRSGRRIDWTGFGALLVGLGSIPYWTFVTGDDWWSYGWVFPCYGVAFAACVLGRVVGRWRGKGSEERLEVGEEVAITDRECKEMG
jgi:hypothetical protein